MRRDDFETGPGPMPTERYAELMRARRGAPRPDPLQAVPSREPAARTGDLAATLLGEAASRPLESGELLLVSEEAALADLEAAAAAIAPAGALPELPAALRETPGLAPLLAPRLLSLRVWEAFAWQPSLAEHLRLLADLLRGGARLPLVMLVGHLETFPERVEHLTRLRSLIEAAAFAGGSVVLQVRPAEAADLAPITAADRSAADRLAAILRAARPGGAETDRRHALAIARLALGPGAVVGG